MRAGLACRAIGVVAIAWAGATGKAGAQEPVSAYPSRPVSVVVTLPPGGPVDIEARSYSQKLADFTGRQFLVDNRPGASGTIGSAYVAKAAPNGYTLLLASVSFTITPIFYKTNMPYDVFRDFTPISLMGISPLLLLVTNGLPVNSLEDIVAVSKARPGGLNFGTTGGGGAIHLAGAFLAGTTGTRMTYIHYKGTAPLMGDLVEGRLQLGVSNPVLGMTYVKSGKLKMIGISARSRLRSMPEVRTLAELGANGYSFYGWTGFLAPAKTPAGIVARLNTEMDKVAKAPDIIAKFDAVGTEVVGGPPENLARYMAEEHARWSKTIAESGIQLEE